MALLTKAQIRTQVKQAIDDPDAKRWSDGNLDVLISLVGDTIWQQVLDTFPWFLNENEVPAPDADGKVVLSTLTKRFYRIQRVMRTSDSKELHPRLFNETVPQPAYYLLGDNLVTDPVVATPATVTIDYSYLPVKFVDLATDQTVVTDWPEGHEAALIYPAAAWAITKGDAESMAQLAQLADNAISAMVDHIARRYPVAGSARTPSIKFQTMRNPLGGVAGK